MNPDNISETFEAAKRGVEVGLIEAGVISPVISQKEAYRIFTKSTIKRLKEKRLIFPRQIGTNTSKILYERKQIAEAIIQELRGTGA